MVSIEVEIEFEIPKYFLCPISLQIMRDPVTTPTGITYDRVSIERWIFTEKHNSCPLTKQPLADGDLIPNHTLRRLIQSWCFVNAANGIERFPTPRQPIDGAQIAKLVDEAKSPQLRPDSLRKLKSIAAESERNRMFVESSGAVDILASFLKDDDESRDEALVILCSLKISEQRLLRLVEDNDEIIEVLTSVLRRSGYQSRAYAIELLESLVAVISPLRLIKHSRDELFEEIVRVLSDRISSKATKAAMKALIGLCPWGRNRITAVNGGAVRILIELLLDGSERRETEIALAALDQLCGCAEGRAEVVAHAAGIAVVSKKVLRVSQFASERAARVIHSVAKFAGTKAVLQEMLRVGAVSKMCLLLQADCGGKTRERVNEILRMHSRVWRSSDCIAPQLQASYPSS